MREELHSGNRSMFSRRLREAIEERVRRGEQTILLLNRRGYSTFVMCRSCGYGCQCPHCDISLTYHRYTRTMRCHYCGYAEREARAMPQLRKSAYPLFRHGHAARGRRAGEAVSRDPGDPHGRGYDDAEGFP